MSILSDLTKSIDKPYYDGVVNSFIESLTECVKRYFDDKSMFDMSDFFVHVTDEFMLGTSVNLPIFTNVYLEIDQPNNYRQDIKSRKKSKDVSKVEIPNLYLKLSDIRAGLTKTFLQYFNSDNIVWQTKYGISIKSTVHIDENTTSDFYFNVIPCLTYYNKQNVRGLYYYSGNEIEIEYPDKLLENFEFKNVATKNAYRDTILIFKNIILTSKDYNSVPFEIIETILYNVPNEFFKSTEKKDMLNIINFIRNNPLKDFKTIDEQDYAFSSIYRSMSVFYVKRVLKIIENYITRSK